MITARCVEGNFNTEAIVILIFKSSFYYEVASVSTLQDIKVPDSSGGYAFTEGGVSNRFIYWFVPNIISLSLYFLILTLTNFQSSDNFETPS